MNVPDISAYNSIYQYIQRYQLIAPGNTLVLGLSGGPDSLFLLHLLAPLHQAGTIKLIAAHLDHGWRADSSQDVKFCRSATNALGINLVDLPLSQLAVSFKNNGSQEEVGRKARRFFLEQVRAEHNADSIALAHHYQDQQETFFIRMMRGASLTGLTAMQPRHGFYIRPLLQTHKRDIISFLDAQKIAYLIDPSNNSNDYLRNRIRNTLLPALRETDTRFDTTFAHTLSQLQETENYLRIQTTAIFKELHEDSPEKKELNVQKLLTFEPIMQQRLILHWLCTEQVPFTPSVSFFNEVLRFLKQPTGGVHTFYNSWSIVKKQTKAYIKKT